MKGMKLFRNCLEFDDLSQLALCNIQRLPIRVYKMLEIPPFQALSAWRQFQWL